MSLRPWTWSPLRTLNDTFRTVRGARGARRRKSAPPAAHRRHLSEPLEKRLMLTTIVNSVGQETIFEYSTLPGVLVRMRVSGNISMELLGASVSGKDNRARIGHLPGRLSGPNPPVDIAGGIGGPGSIDIIGPVSGAVGSNPDINAIASDPVTGDIYAFDVETIPIQSPPPGAPNFITNIYLIQINFAATPPLSPYGPGPGNTINVNGTVVANITGALQAAGQFFPVGVSVAAADFNPINGLLYFVVRSGEDGIDQLFTLDVNAGSIPGSINAIPGTFNDGPDGIAVAGLTFDQTGPGTSQMIVALGEDPGAQGGGGGGGGQGQQAPVTADEATLWVVSQTNTNNFLQNVPYFDNDPGADDEITIGGIQTADDDPTQIDSLLIIGENEHWELIRNDPIATVPDGLLLDLGAMVEPPVPPGDPPLPPGWIPAAAGGTAVAFVPTIVDPYSQQLGAYIGYDAATDRLFFINRFESGNPGIPNTIYQVYVASSDATARISVARVNIADPARPMQPFQGPALPGGIGALRVFNAQNGQLLDVPAPGGVGPVFIGAVTRDLNPNDPNEDRRPLLEALVDPGVGLGLLPVSTLATDPATGLPLVPAGINVIGDLDKLLVDGTITGSFNAVAPTPAVENGPSGSINQVFFGWVLTGDARGEPQLSGPTRPQNFRVVGDLRDLYVLDSVGTGDLAVQDNPTYVTGFDLSVGGKLGHVRAGDGWIGDSHVENAPEFDATRGINTPQREVEFRTGNNNTNSAWDAYEFSANPIFFNDTFDTPQFLGSIEALGQSDMIQLQGNLQHTPNNGVNDWVDYYGVALMAGQSIQVLMLSTFGPGLPYLGVFDPDGRLVATEASDVLATGYGQTFQVTSDRPGIYRLAVGMPLNYGFYNNQQDGSNIPAAPYEIRVTGVGDIGVGGINVVGNMLDVGPRITIGASHTLEFGDFGAIRAGGMLASIDPGLVSTATVRVNTGNLRVLDGASIGFGTAGTPPDPNDPTSTGTAATLNAPVQVDVPAGSVGLVRARTGILFFNSSGTLEGRPPIGGDYQLVDAVSSCYVELIADRGLGILRAGDMITSLASTITVNFDNIGNDGIIDLIDVTGNFGSLTGGGPGITTNTGGNLRFLRVGGTAFTDLAFGGGFGTPIGTIHLPGETVSLVDDSGSTMNLIPAPQRFNSAGTPITLQPDFLLVRSYAIRGSGGVALMDVRANDSFTIQGTGNHPDATAEIGRIIMEAGSVGSGVVLNYDLNGPVFPNPAEFATGFDPINPGFGGDLGEQDYRRTPNPFRLFGAAPPGSQSINDPGGPQGDLDIIIDGTSEVDVWDIVAADGPINTDGKFTSIRNNTKNGELINIRAASVGEIVSRGSIGIAKSTVVPGMTLQPLAYYNDESPGENFPGGLGGGPQAPGYTGYYATNVGQFPYIDQRYGVWITGDVDENGGTGATPAELLLTPPEPGNVISIRAGQGVGNIIVNGSIGEIFPNDDGTREEGVFAGIQGIVWARGNTESVVPDPFLDRGGDIWYVDIGEGIAASGSGSAIRAGIYAARHIDHIFGSNADIRGNIVAGDNIVRPRNRVPIPPGVNQPQLPGQGDPSGVRPRFVPNVLDFPKSIRLIELKNGSIINANIGVVASEFTTVEQALRITLPEDNEEINNPEFELGRVVVSGNGGIIGTSFQAADVGLIDVNGGFGIFTSELLLGGTGVLGGMEADNYGIRQVVGNVGGSMNFLNARGDGSSRSTIGFSPSVRRSELGYTGIVADPLSGFPANVLTDLHAALGTSAATPELPGRTDTGVLEDVDFRGQRDFGSVRAQQIRATSPDLLPSVLNFANTFGTLHVRDVINGLRMTTGRMGSFRPESDVYNLDLTVSGPLKDLLIKGDLAEGSVVRTQGRVGNMGNIKVLGRLDGDILSSGKIKRLFVGESISGNIQSSARKGNAVGQLIIGGDIAEGGLNIQGNMGRIVIAGDFGRTGTDFSVQGKLGSLTVKGNLFSNIHVGTVLGKLNVGGSIISGVLVEAQRINSVRVGGDVQPGVVFRSRRAPKIRTGGQMLGDVQIIP